MKALLGLSKVIDSITAFVGKAAAWLVLVAVLVSAGNAVVRKVFSISSNAWLELQWYLFGAVFMLAAAYTLQNNEHIRIDIVFGMQSKKVQDRIDLFGHLFFLLPFTVLMVWLFTPYVIRSFNIQEHSANAGGLIIWPAKSMLLAGFVLLLAQAISEIIKRIAIMRGIIDDPNPHQSGHAPLEEDEVEIARGDIHNA
ncbi:MAG: TRAP transporter small permease subunit [Hyphomicrobiaceae bacterium]|nr:TRAP transporter small permease subunit [Hyphomicrobiaceae bacterium]MCC0025131.1 TRAP transporter small permease subunit [Hyphomicrobiaceae bacterium]